MNSDELRGPDLSTEEFKRLGIELVCRLSEFLADIDNRPVMPPKMSSDERRRFRIDRLPEHGSCPDSVIEEILPVLLNNSVLTGHPRFWGFICSSASPIGALAELITAFVNVNAASALMAPVGSEIESQTIRWIAELLGFPDTCGGILVSGGNIANFTALLVARRSKSIRDVRTEGLNSPTASRMRIYASKAVHTWLHKAVDCSGLGLASIHWIASDEDHRLVTRELRAAIELDLESGLQPFLVIGTAGTVACGSVDPLEEIADIAQQYDLWFHVDGAYGAPAISVSGADHRLAGLRRADSVAIDPHKWLYVPVEAGCILIRNSDMLRDTFYFMPDYYDLAESCDAKNYFEYGIQNTRNLRALKVWMCLRHMGRRGLVEALEKNIACARRLYELAIESVELEAMSQSLSITTLRYVPKDTDVEASSNDYVDQLNREILLTLQSEGSFFLTNAVVRGHYALRACVVNFRTTLKDMDAAVARILVLGRTIVACRSARPSFDNM